MTDTEILNGVLASLDDLRIADIGATRFEIFQMVNFIVDKRKDTELATIGQGLKKVNDAQSDEDWAALLAKLKLEFVPRTDFDDLREKLRQQAERLTLSEKV